MNIADISHPDPRIQRTCRRYALGLMRNPNVRRGDGNVQEQVQNYMESTERYQILSLRVREILTEYDIPYSVSLVYRNFANRVLKVMDKYELLTRHIQILEAVDRGIMYGCDRQILFRICRDILGYDIEETGRELHCEE